MPSAVMNRSRVGRAPAAFALVTGLTLALAGCGGGDDDDAAGSSPSVEQSASSSPSASASETESSTAGADDAASATMVPVPTEEDGSPGLENAAEFPTPASAVVDDSLGAPFNGSWQFFVTGVTPGQLADFYVTTLPALGYTATKDCKIVVGVNTVPCVVGWTGPTSGTVSKEGLVSVNDRPADGLTLDGALVSGS